MLNICFTYVLHMLKIIETYNAPEASEELRRSEALYLIIEADYLPALSLSIVCLIARLIKALRLSPCSAA